MKGELARGRGRINMSVQTLEADTLLLERRNEIDQVTQASA